MKKDSVIKNVTNYTRKFSLKKELKTNGELWIMITPVILFYVIFCYVPMYGVLMAFQDYKPMLGISRSPWIGLENFNSFFPAFQIG